MIGCWGLRAENDCLEKLQATKSRRFLVQQISSTDSQKPPSTAANQPANKHFTSNHFTSNMVDNVSSFSYFNLWPHCTIFKEFVILAVSGITSWLDVYFVSLLLQFSLSWSKLLLISWVSLSFIYRLWSEVESLPMWPLRFCFSKKNKCSLVTRLAQP